MAKIRLKPKFVRPRIRGLFLPTLLALGAFLHERQRAWRRGQEPWVSNGNSSVLCLPEFQSVNRNDTYFIKVGINIRGTRVVQSARHPTLGLGSDL